MKRSRVSMAVCAAAAAALLACDDGAAGASGEAQATACTVVQNGGGWWNQAFAEQTGRFHVEFSATPSARGIDTVVGLSNGPATRWTSLAAIVRFNPQGYIDARSGDTYRADGTWPYSAGTTYHFRIDVDMAIRGYAVWLRTDPTRAWNLLGRFTFRTEQLNVTRLNNVASYTNPETSAPGGIELCGFTAVRDATPTADCVVSTAGGGFANTPLAISDDVLMVALRARATQANMDGVIGVASGDVDRYDDFAASLRFWTNGMLEVRDGDTYRADRAVAYGANQEFDIRMFVDLPSHTYSVYVNTPGLTPNNEGHVLLASGYKFRPAQARAVSLDRLATVVASSTGGVEACQIAGGPHPPVVAMRDGTWQVKPLRDGSTLISKYDRTERLGSNNAPLASALSFGGKVAADAAGNIYIAQTDAGAQHVTVTSYAPDFSTRRWSYTYPVSASAHDIAVTANGFIVVAIGGTSPFYLLRLAADGRFVANDPLPGGTSHVALAPGEYIVARGDSAGYVFERYAYGDPARPLRARQVACSCVVTQLALAHDGSFAIGGDLYGPTNFGDGELAPEIDHATSTYLRAFVAAFAPNDSTRFSRRLGNAIRGLSTTGRWVAVANETFSQASYVDVVVFEPNGDVTRSSTHDAFVGDYGTPGEIAIADTGLVYLNLSASLADSFETQHPFLVSLGLW